MTQRKPLVAALTEFQQKRPFSFHVPGHKNGMLSGLPADFKQVLPYDLTELTGLDDLHYPEEVIKEAQQLLAETYAAEHSFFLVNGSTVGNLAMIYAVCGEGDHVIVQRNSHKSIFHALELAKARPVFISPEWDQTSLTAGGVRLTDVEAVIREYPNAKAIVLTYPNYYGMASNEMGKIIELCHEQGMPVLVDEAHGAHFQLGAPYPLSSLKMGADAVVHSAHKTLPAMTMGSFLHIQGPLIAVDKVRKYLRMLQSSSPSYVIMASLDDARSYLQTYSQADKKSFEEKRHQFVESLKSLPNLEVYEADDPLKLMLRVPYHSGYQLKEQLEQEGIHAELADPYQVLLILPLLKREHGFSFAEVRRRVKRALAKLKEIPRKAVDVTVQPQEAVSKLEATFAELEGEGEWISYTKAQGRISAAMIVPYPPGIPLVLAGERWSTDKLESLMDYIATGAQIQGEHRLSEKLIRVLPEKNRP